MQKVLVLFLFFLFLFPVSPSSYDINFLTRKYQGVAIGQLTLAYRLISLSTSLAISKAVDKEYIISLLDNVDATVMNSKRIIASNDRDPDPLTLEILKGIEFFVTCSKNVKEYSSNQNYENLTKVRVCIENSSNIIDSLTDNFNSLNKKELEKKEVEEKKSEKEKRKP